MAIADIEKVGDFMCVGISFSISILHSSILRYLQYQYQMEPLTYSNKPKPHGIMVYLE